MGVVLIIISVLLAVIAAALVAIAVFLNQRKEPVFNLKFDSPSNTFNVKFPDIPQPVPANFNVTFPKIPQPEVPQFHVTFPEIPQAIPSTFNVTFPEIPQPVPATFNVTFPDIPPVSVQLPQILMPPPSVVITHGIPGQNGQPTGDVHHMHAPMASDSAEILKIDSNTPEGYTVVGRRPLDHPDIREAVRDPKLRVRYSDGTLSE